MDFSDLMHQTLLLDLETTRTGRIRHVGAVFNGQIFEKQAPAGSRAVLESLEHFARPAAAILGHNLLGHDFPLLRAAAPRLELLAKPVIDTLYLSPLAFPENPYHRLVKDYKLVRSAINRPVEDARLAASVFADQWQSFTQTAAGRPALPAFYRFCFEQSRFNGFSGAGMAAVFARLTDGVITGAHEALAVFLSLAGDSLCRQAARKEIPDLLADEARRPAAAYCLAWLQVAGGNSVLPPWVRHRFPEIPELIRRLRETPCGFPDCAYCRENHDPDRQLKRFFGHPSFRQEPRTQAGESLQRALVCDGMGDLPVLGILPTGGGKSLCYQLPALVRYWRRGTLTVVISPLQALMKDQVDNLVKKTGTPFAEAVSGLQTAPERGEIFERVRLGDTAILYLAPEQLRSIGVRRVLQQREIGAWIFDEAHCLSKWGHDFRPDYLYAARFIREFAKAQNLPVPPVSCFTATAKKSVIEEITAHFEQELGQNLRVYAGGVERDNLSFEVVPVSTAEKLERTLELIRTHLADGAGDPGGVIVYAATRAATGEIRDFLHHQGILAETFHGGLEAVRKREIIEGFIEGQVPVICATNAFGMGIDKENIRLVLHYSMPGSLENYIQEAGRAGRDQQPARCVLLYDPQDVHFQFSMGAMSEVKQKEISRILRALRRKKTDAHGEIVVTGDELLRDEEWAEMQTLRPELRDTKVRAAVAWLERAGFLERNQNLTEAFQGKPRVESLQAAQAVMDRLDLAPPTRGRWLNILQQIFNCHEDRGMRADALAEALFPEKETLLAMERRTGMTAAQIVIADLHAMAEAGLLDQGLMLAATFRPKGKDNAFKVFQDICDIENSLVALMQTRDPDAEQGHWVDLDIRRLNQLLANEGYAVSPDVLRRLIKGISYDGKGFAASQGSFEIAHLDRNRYRVRLTRSWQTIRKTISLRQNVAHLMLKTFLDMARHKAAQSGAPLSGDLRLTFTSDELSAAIRADLFLSVHVTKVLPAIERALMFLHEEHIIVLQNGLAILRQAMTLRLAQPARGRHFNRGDYKPLAVHYRERRFQVHVMMRYATLGLDKIARALTLVFDYFTLGRVRFIHKYFEGESEILEKATTAESFRRIVESLRNPEQIGAVGRPAEDNQLILAGPGAGKTRVIVHRCAYLLEVERVPARQILVLCFNHGSAMVVRKRLRDLGGKAARGVTIATYHGVAMRLAGISIRDMTAGQDQDHIDFERMIQDAVDLLNGKKEIPGIEADEHRDRLLAGYSHILVDEYQDIDRAQYELVSAIAGRTLAEEDGRLSILAVGDDDQNIYTFRGANVEFIRRFETDYRPAVVHLVENYRSSRHIIAASNALIRCNKDRMKGNHPIRIDRARVANAAGGRWERLDPLSRGRVQIVAVANELHQACHIKNEIDRLKQLDPKTEWSDIAILARTRAGLAGVRTVLEAAGYPVRTILDRGFPFHRIREIRMTLEWLEARGKETLRASTIKQGIDTLRGNPAQNPWWDQIDLFFEDYQTETLDSILPAGLAIDRLYEFAAEQRREKVIGRGIFLGTIHAAKGMEFAHVFILDGDWSRPATRTGWEEERRVMYVGMTRARETLHLLKISGRSNPFLREIKGDCAISLVAREVLADGRFEKRAYEMLRLDDIYLDFAGRRGPSDPIHRSLAELQTGQSVSFRSENGKVGICDARNRSLAQLSNSAAAAWGERLDEILDLRVVAVLRRMREDSRAEFQSRIRTAAWELPLVEVVRRVASGKRG